MNKTNGRWPDSQIYWAIIGRDWKTGQFVHVDRFGNLIPMAINDNVMIKPGDFSGNRYANYFYSLSSLGSVNIPAIDSARLLMSVGTPMYIQVVRDADGYISYAGANIDNSSDPNQDVIFDFGEFAILPKNNPSGGSAQGIFINTTRVDQFGFPLQLRVEGESYNQTRGENLAESRDQLFSQFASQLPSEFASLANPHPDVVPAKTRIAAPAQWSFSGQISGGGAGSNSKYLDGYIASMWDYFKTHTLVFSLQGLGTFQGHVDSSDNFIFNGGHSNGTYYILRKPSTQEVMLGSGVLASASGQHVDADISIQLQIQAQICAALNRHVLQSPQDWYNPKAFYPRGFPSNWYSKFWHDHSLAAKGGDYGLSYGFPYDDVGDFSSSLHTVAPKKVTFTIGW